MDAFVVTLGASNASTPSLALPVDSPASGFGSNDSVRGRSYARSFVESPRPNRRGSEPRLTDVSIGEAQPSAGPSANAPGSSRICLDSPERAGKEDRRWLPSFSSLPLIGRVAGSKSKGKDKVLKVEKKKLKSKEELNMVESSDFDRYRTRAPTPSSPSFPSSSSHPSPSRLYSAAPSVSARSVASPVESPYTPTSHTPSPITSNYESHSPATSIYPPTNSSAVTSAFATSSQSQSARPYPPASRSQVSVVSSGSVFSPQAGSSTSPSVPPSMPSTSQDPVAAPLKKDEFFLDYCHDRMTEHRKEHDEAMRQERLVPGSVSSTNRSYLLGDARTCPACAPLMDNLRFAYTSHHGSGGQSSNEATKKAQINTTVSVSSVSPCKTRVERGNIYFEFALLRGTYLVNFSLYSTHFLRLRQRALRSLRVPTNFSPISFLPAFALSPYHIPSPTPREPPRHSSSKQPRWVRIRHCRRACLPQATRIRTCRLSASTLRKAGDIRSGEHLYERSFPKPGRNGAIIGELEETGDRWIDLDPQYSIVPWGGCVISSLGPLFVVAPQATAGLKRMDIVFQFMLCPFVKYAGKDVVRPKERQFRVLNEGDSVEKVTDMVLEDICEHAVVAVEMKGFNGDTMMDLRGDTESTSLQLKSNTRTASPPSLPLFIDDQDFVHLGTGGAQRTPPEKGSTFVNALALLSPLKACNWQLHDNTSITNTLQSAMHFQTSLALRENKPDENSGMTSLGLLSPGITSTSEGSSSRRPSNTTSITEMGGDGRSDSEPRHVHSTATPSDKNKNKNKKSKKKGEDSEEDGKTTHQLILQQDASIDPTSLSLTFQLVDTQYVEQDKVPEIMLTAPSGDTTTTTPPTAPNTAKASLADRKRVHGENNAQQEGGDQHILYTECFMVIGIKVLEGVGKYVVIVAGTKSCKDRMTIALRRDTENTLLRLTPDALAKLIAKIASIAGLPLLIALMITSYLQFGTGHRSSTPAGKDIVFVNILIIPVTSTAFRDENPDILMYQDCTSIQGDYTGPPSTALSTSSCSSGSRPTLPPLSLPSSLPYSPYKKNAPLFPIKIHKMILRLSVRQIIVVLLSHPNSFPTGLTFPHTFKDERTLKTLFNSCIFAQILNSL
ncbi:hypothetical protein NMY22_g12269 [Coprinellus aureogranulatus]|nr:hypothetical protein NMY22_g12269 [Coprinellus aureogranulatus]